jgi:uncharacterized protein YqjF (DUF2071 family)
MVGRCPDAAVRVPLNLQQWHLVTFLHWRVEAALLQPMLPQRLVVDEIDGSGWIGVTPFVMRRVRVPGSPLPVVRDFVEVNVRTYVQGPDGRDGIWFFSLECSRLPVVAALRTIGLPYVRARTAVRTPGRSLVEYVSRRQRGGGELLVRARRGAPLAEPDALVNALTGRWNAYTERWGKLWLVPVEHEPWPLLEAQAQVDVGRLLAANGLPTPDAAPLVHHAPVVHVRVGAPRPA